MAERLLETAVDALSANRLVLPQINVEKVNTFYSKLKKIKPKFYSFCKVEKPIKTTADKVAATFNQTNNTDHNSNTTTKHNVHLHPAKNAVALEAALHRALFSWASASFDRSVVLRGVPAPAGQMYAPYRYNFVSCFK